MEATQLPLGQQVAVPPTAMAHTPPSDIDTDEKLSDAIDAGTVQ